MCVCVLVCVVARFARERVQPLVKKMDAESQMDPSIITDMFSQGVSDKTYIPTIAEAPSL